MIRIVQAPWFAAVLGTVAFLATMAALMKLPPMQVAAHTDTRALPSPGNDPSWKFRNPEFDQWLTELREEKQNLQAKEAQLKELQGRLEAERAELNVATQLVSQLQADFDRSVVRYKAQEDENLKREIKLLSTMPLETTIKMLLGKSNEDAVRLLILMKTEQTAQILDTISKSGKEESKRAATLMDMMRRSMPEEAGKTAKAPAA